MTKHEESRCRHKDGYNVVPYSIISEKELRSIHSTHRVVVFTYCMYANNFFAEWKKCSSHGRRNNVHQSKTQLNAIRFNTGVLVELSREST